MEKPLLTIEIKYVILAYMYVYIEMDSLVAIHE